MRDMKKMAAVILAASMTASLTACGGAEKETTAAAASAAVTEAAAEAETEAAAEGKTYKVALCLSGASNDMGWCQVAYEGLLSLEENYGCEIAYTENLTPDDIEAAFADYAANGYDVVIGHGYEFGDPAMQGASLVKIMNGFEDGAKEINPDIEVMTAWTGSFTDVALGKEAAQAMIDNGADVIGHCANESGNGCITAAKEAGVYATGDSYDQNSLAPETVLSSSMYHISHVVELAFEDVLNGEYAGGIYHFGMADDAVSIADYHGLADKIPAEVKEMIETRVAEIKAGEFDAICDEQVRQ